MTTAEERLRILQMIQEGKISAEEGAKLLQALGGTSKQSRPPTPANDPRLLHVRITDLNTGRTKANINIPMSLVNVGIKFGARFAPSSTEIDYDEILEAIRGGASGMIVDVEDVESGEHIEVWVE